MSNNNDEAPTNTLDRTFAVMLAELEDAETALTQRQAALARQLDDVSSELDRLANVKAAMLGKPTKKVRTTRAEPSKAGPTTPAAQEKVRAIIGLARERDGEPFTGAQAAERLGINAQGVGPVLAGMVRRGELAREDHEGGRPTYRLPT